MPLAPIRIGTWKSSATDTLEFLQIGIEPNVYCIDPGYQLKRFESRQGLQLITSPDMRDESLLIHQDASFYHLRLNAGQTVSHALEPGRRLCLHVVSGRVSVHGESLNEGDGATLMDLDKLDFSASENCEALLFDLP